MNGELMNMIQLSLTAKYYLKNKKIRSFFPDNAQQGRVSFNFAEISFGEHTSKAASVEGIDRWVKALSNRRAEDIKLMVVDKTNDFDRLAYANGFPCFIFCFYDGGVTVWNKKWTKNENTGLWDVQLNETVCENPPAGKPEFYDVTGDYTTILTRMRDFSRKLGLGEFSLQFSAAINALNMNFAKAEYMPSANYKLINSVIQAYVFGEKGSWNDKAKFIAAGKGLAEEYLRLTGDLYKGLALACMYAVNEW